MTTEATTADATEAATANPAEGHVVTREEMDQVTKTRHGFYALPNGSRILFSSIRRSVLYAIDGNLFDEDGKIIDEMMRQRPARVMAAVLCDSKGARLYRDDEWERVDALKPSIFEPLWKAVRKHLDLEREDEAGENTAPNA